MEQLALGVARMAIGGPLSPREHTLAIEIAHFLSSTLIDQQADIQDLTALVLEQRRLMG